MLSVEKLFDDYLKQWYADHRDAQFKGMKPVSYHEWLDNEFLEFKQLETVSFILTHFHYSNRQGGAVYLLKDIDEVKELISEIAQNPKYEWGGLINGFDLSYKDIAGNWNEWRDENGRDITDVLNDDDFTNSTQHSSGREL